MSTVTVNYFGVSGTGRTVKEAKLDAGRKIESALGRSPQAYAYRGWALFLYWTPDGGGYKLVGPHNSGSVDSGHFCSADDLERHGLSHMMQNARQDGEYVCPPFIPKEYRRSFIDQWRHNDGFQRAYRKAKEIGGMGDADMHQFACEHTKEFVTPDIPCGACGENPAAVKVKCADDNGVSSMWVCKACEDASTCHECNQATTDEDRVLAGMKCGPCAYTA